MTNDHVGRVVAYQPYPGASLEYGVITSTNDQFVFVRYRNQHPEFPGKATRREDLSLVMRPGRPTRPRP